MLGVDRTSVRYRATRPDDGALWDRLETLAQERRRFGYRRLYAILRREGHVVNRKRVQRLYRGEKLTVRRRGGRKRAMGARRPLEPALVANQRLRNRPTHRRPALVADTSLWLDEKRGSRQTLDDLTPFQAICKA